MSLHDARPVGSLRDARQRLAVSIAESREDVTAAQSLRYRIFVEEMGANIGARRSAVERDRFDPFCEHLIVRDMQTGQVIGTYRLLTPERAGRLGTYIAEREFDLSRFDPVRATLAELGRACVHPRYRHGAAIMLLWSGIAQFIKARGYRHLFGCASIAMSDGGANAQRVYQLIARDHLAPAEFRAEPRSPVRDPGSHEAAAPEVPALLKGYLRLGAWICGPPAWDPEFNTADLLVLLPLERVEARYARHFLQDQGPPN